MAVRTIIETGEGAVGQVPEISVKDGRLTEEQATSLSSGLRALVTRVSGGLTLGSGATGTRAGNFDWQVITHLTPAVANTEFLVPHGLGRTPWGYIVVQKDKAVDVYMSSFGSWDNESIYLKADAASATITLLVW